jgi:endonuclease/exonuclease/phosphatase (EEP) superfamily protein YafD
VLRRDKNSKEPVRELVAVVRPPKWRRIGALAVSLACWAYLAAVIAIWVFIRIDGDRWWLATMMLFGPRWLLLVPLAVMLPLALAFRRRWLWGLLGIAVLVAGPMMDLRITKAGLFPVERQSDSLRVLTFNTHFAYVDPVRLGDYIAMTKPDIVALQEWYAGYRGTVFPIGASGGMAGKPWHVIQLEEAILASTYPIRVVGEGMIERDIEKGVTYRYNIELPQGAVTFYSVHLSSPHSSFRDVLHRSPYGVPRLTNNQNERLREARNLERDSDDDTILAGDFNLPRDSTIFRSALSGFADAFTDAGLGYGWTYYSRWTTVRIDHVLMGKNWYCQHCWVGPNLGSPHRLVVADLARAK